MRVSVQKMCRIAISAFWNPAGVVSDVCIQAVAKSSQGSVDFSEVESIAEAVKSSCIRSAQMEIVDKFVVMVKYHAKIG